MAAPAGRISLLRLSAITLRTLLVAAIGGIAFDFLGMPVPWLSGGMLAVAVATLSGLPVAVPVPMRETAFFMLGLSIGATLTPETLQGLAVWPLSLFILCATVPLITAAGTVVLLWRGGWRRDDAVLATMPGAVSLVIALADSIGADVARIAIVQVLRLAVLVLVLPSVIALIGGAGEATPLPAMETSLPAADLFDLAIILTAGVAVAFVFRLLRVPTPGMLGAMAASGVLHAGGFVEAAVPQIVLVPCFLLLGAMIGARFNGLSPSDIRISMIDGLLAFVAAFVVALVSAGVVTAVLDLPFGQTVLAFAPGGFEVMAVMAFVLGFDAAYVAMHQVARFLVLALSAPLFIRGRERDAQAGEATPPR